MKLYEIEHQSAYISGAPVKKSYIKAVTRWNAIFRLQARETPVFQVVKKIDRVGPFINTFNKGEEK